MIVTLPGGSQVDVDETVTTVTDDNGSEIKLHVPQALGRLIAYWHDKPNFRLLVADYMTEIQELENAIWQTILLRTLDYAGTAQLDVLGRIVGEARDGSDNANFILRIKARIRANNSYGTGADVIAVLRLITDVPFHFKREGVASFRIDFDGVVSDAVMCQVPALVTDSRAAGIGASVSFLPSVSGVKYGSVTDPTLNQHNGYGSVLLPTPKYSHVVSA